MLYKPGHNITKFGARKRTTVCTYSKNSVIMTTKTKEQIELERTFKTAANVAAEAASSS